LESSGLAVSAFVIPTALASQTSQLKWLVFGFWNHSFQVNPLFDYKTRGSPEQCSPLLPSSSSLPSHAIHTELSPSPPNLP
jgi:hypothetical protein